MLTISNLYFNLIQKIYPIHIERILFNFFAFVAIFRVGKRCADIFYRLDLVNFQSIYLWKCFIISITSYSLILLLSFIYSKLFKTLSTSLLFLGSLFSLYFLTLLNSLTFRLPDTLFIRLCLASIFIAIGYKAFINKNKENLPSEKRHEFSIIIGALIFMWFIHSLLFFAEYNFNLNRIPFGDESSFWFAVAKNMIQRDLMSAQLITYPAGGLCSFAIPFISAFPAKLFGVSFQETIFFMPLVIIIALFLFLCSIKSNKWCFLFFYLALISSFNNLGWLGQLCYRVIYGEGVSMIFFLLISYEIKALTDNNDIKIKNLLLMSFCIGLLSLGKLPTSYFSVIFSIIFIILFNLNEKPMFHKRLFSLLAFITSLIPFTIWKLFSIFYGISSSPFFEKLKDLSTDIRPNVFFFYHINFNMLKNVTLDLTANCPDAIYFSIISFGIALMMFRKKEFIHLIPAICLLFSVFLYYGFIYKGADPGSSIRYLMPQTLALFYFGAIGYNKLINRIDKYKWHNSIQFLIIFFLNILIVIKLF